MKPLYKALRTYAKFVSPVLLVWITYEIYVTPRHERWYDVSNFTSHTTGTFQHVDNAEIFVKSPFYDPRISGEEVIRMWAFTVWHPPTVYCHVRFAGNTESAVIFKAYVKPHIVYVPPFCKWYTAVVLCFLPSRQIPTHVAISTSNKRTKATIWHNVKVPSYQPPSSTKYGVCLNTLFDLPDKDEVVHRVVEWFEMQKILGVHKVMLYGTSNVSRPILETLKTYVDSGFLIYHQWDIPFKSLTPNIYKQSSNDPEIENTRHSNSQANCVTFFAQHLSYMDCLYRYMDDFNYLGFFDIDEMVIPINHYTLAEMMDDIKSKKMWSLSLWQKLWYNSNSQPAAYFFSEACFESRIKQSNYVKGDKMRIYLATKATERLHRFRGIETDECHVKSIVEPSLAVDMYVHFPEKALPGHPIMVKMDTDVGRLHHYKNPAGICKISKDTVVIDHSMSKYYKYLAKNMELTLSEIQQKIRH